ncbi:MAG: ketopantoate reductase family protein [Myxococcales bacterium]|nr:MAG: ketopantoate reductase family protein [Myxococcales bacterium]
MQTASPTFVVIGAGAIGASAAAWAAAAHPSTVLLARGESLSVCRERGVTLYPIDDPAARKTYSVRMAAGLEDVRDAEVVAIAVKNYSLDAVARQVREVLGDRPLVVGLQNGLTNQTILPKYFSKVLYGVVAYNAWVDEPGVVGYQTKGPLILGSPDNRRLAEARALAAVLNRGLPTEATDRFQDAAHGKLVINLANSITTLLGHGVRPVEDLGHFQKILAGALWEGVTILKAAGFRESRLGGIPPWRLIWAAARLPQTLTRGLFRRNLRKMVLSSMANDVYQRRTGLNELEDINGYLVSLAEKHGAPAPINRAILDLCRESFSRPNPEPLDPKRVWERIQAQREGVAADFR